jgi:hypothetical protein
MWRNTTLNLSSLNLKLFINLIGFLIKILPLSLLVPPYKWAYYSYYGYFYRFSLIQLIVCEEKTLKAKRKLPQGTFLKNPILPFFSIAIPLLNYKATLVRKSPKK